MFTGQDFGELFGKLVGIHWFSQKAVKSFVRGYVDFTDMNSISDNGNSLKTHISFQFGKDFIAVNLRQFKIDKGNVYFGKVLQDMIQLVYIGDDRGDDALF